MKKGFSLVEALTSIVIVIFLVLGIVGMLELFMRQIPDRMLLTCLVHGAVSGINSCRAGSPINSLTCLGYNINISIKEGSCNPSENPCEEVEVEASYGNKSFTLNSVVCNFY